MGIQKAQIVGADVEGQGNLFGLDIRVELVQQVVVLWTSHLVSYNYFPYKTINYRRPAVGKMTPKSDTTPTNIKLEKHGSHINI